MDEPLEEELSAPLTPHEQKILLGMWAMGFACGLFHPFEWYMNYVSSFMMALPYIVADAVPIPTIRLRH
jgi:hypothetical protein